VVVALRDAAGTGHELGQVGAGGEYVDDGLPPRVPVFYRVVTVDRDGLRSDGSPVSSAQPYDGGPPPEPVWLAAAWEAGADGAEVVVLRWQFPDAAGRTVRCQVQKRRVDASRWLPASGWLTPDSGPTGAWMFRDPRVDPAADYQYRLGVSAVSGPESHFEAPPLARPPGGGP
jgi:hypothetical protein